MVLSKRERYIAIGTAAALILLLLDTFALSPLIKADRDSTDQRISLGSQLADAKALIAKRARLAPKWAKMTQAGMKSDPAEAESLVFHAIQSWADESGMKLMQNQPVRTTEKTPLPEINFQVNGTGSLRAAAQMIWSVQNAAIPIKIKKLQINTRKEGTDDLTFQFTMSTVYAPPGAVPTTSASSLPVAGGR
jgi:hypothetical protein